MSWTFVQHVHTRHSFDSIADPAVLVRRAEEVGIEVLAVTDHDTWQGSIEAREAARKGNHDVHVVLGTEQRTDRGDLIGMFLSEDVKERDALAFCDAVHAQRGIVVVPHPYKWHRLDDALLERVDVIEVHNARCSSWENTQASAMASERGLATLVGPDAHRAAELLLARNEFDGAVPADESAMREAILHAPRRFHTRRGSIWNEWLSQGVKFSRQPSLGLGWGLIRGATRRILKPGAYSGS
jgi:hypothetical protein